MFNYVIYFFTLISLSALVYHYIYHNDVLLKLSARRNYIPPSEFNKIIPQLHKELSNVEFLHQNDDVHSDFRNVFDTDSHKNRIVGILFSSCILLSILLIILMMVEIGDLLFVEEERLNMFLWTIHTLMLMLILVQPFLIASLLINQDLLPRNQKRRVIFTISVFGLWLLLLHKCGSQSFVQQVNRTFLENKINEISMAGITILAILSGVASILTPYRVYGLDLKLEKVILKSARPAVRVSDINSLVVTYNSTAKLLEKRKDEQERISEETAGKSSNPNLKQFIHRVSSFASISTSSDTSTEISSLENLKSSLYDDINKLVFKFSSQRKTTPHKILHYINFIFGVYCAYRIFNVMFLRLPYFYFHPIDNYELHSPETNVIKEGTEPITTPNDALATTLAKIILGIFSIPLSEAQLTSQLSFVLLGLLFICSMSNVFLTFKSFANILPNNTRHDKNIKTWLKHLFASELFGIYVMATALLIRTNLPTSLSFQISQILSLLGPSANTVAVSIREVAFIDRWFDKVFGLSCLITVIGIVGRKLLEEDLGIYADHMV